MSGEGGRPPMALTDFLLARIAEDEALCRNTAVGWWPDRDAAEFEAKRRIVDRYSVAAEGADWEIGYEHGTRDALADLAEVYSDHPDYRQEWKP